MNDESKYCLEYFDRAMKNEPRYMYQTINSLKKEFVLFTGPMFGGKTTRMLSELDKHRYKGREIFAFKPAIDNRYDKENIVSHNGGAISANVVSSAKEMVEILVSAGALDLEKHRFNAIPPVIALDEVFMLKGAGEVLPYLFKCGATIVASTIQLNSDGNPFEEILNIMPYATRVEVCTAVCDICGADAFYTEKVGGRDDFEVEVGGKELYAPRCFHHFRYFHKYC